MTELQFSFSSIFVSDTEHHYVCNYFFYYLFVINFLGLITDLLQYHVSHKVPQNAVSELIFQSTADLKGTWYRHFFGFHSYSLIVAVFSVRSILLMKLLFSIYIQDIISKNKTKWRYHRFGFAQIAYTFIIISYVLKSKLLLFWEGDLRK